MATKMEDSSSLNAADIAALAQQLAALQVAAAPAATLAAGTQTVSAVSVKIPQFWHSRPEVWFAVIESQFASKHITADDTKYHYAVTALDRSVAEEISAFLCDPPAQNKYQALKNLLLLTYGLTQTDKDAKLLAISGLGDRKPTALLRYMDSLTSVDDRKTTLYKALFLSHLPQTVRLILSRDPPADINALAVAADEILTTQATTTTRAST
jgi:hypothetical protein